MANYTSSVFSSAFFWVIVAGCLLMFVYGEFGAMYYRKTHQGQTNVHKDPIYWLFTAIWIGVFVSYAFSTVLAHRRISYRSDVFNNNNAESDAQKLLCVFIIIVLLTCVWITAVMLYKSDAIGLVVVVLLMIAIAYQAGLTAKWGCSGEDDCCCYDCYCSWEDNEDEEFCYKFGNGKGSVGLLLPYFVWLAFGGLVLPIAQGRLWAKKDEALFFDTVA